MVASGVGGDENGAEVGADSGARGFSGRKRMRVTDCAACYHVMSRVVNSEFLLGAIEKEALRRMMWRMAKFSGVEILTYVILDNHLHILLKAEILIYKRIHSSVRFGQLCLMRKMRNSPMDGVQRNIQILSEVFREKSQNIAPVFL